MLKLRYSEITEEDFVPISELILEDTEEIKEIISLYQKEVEYIEFLQPIESFIAHYYYYDKPKLRDIHLIRAIRKIRTNLDKDLNFFEEDFEKELIGIINLVLKHASKKITKHELLLVLKYILWSVDNRKHLGDSRGYLKWIANFFKLLDDDEKKSFDKTYESYGTKFGKSEQEIKMMKGESGDEIECPVDEIILSRLDSENFEDNINEDGEDGEWVLGQGGFIETISPEEMEIKKKSIHMGHDEDVNYNCKKCNKKISLHNKDWHGGMCDECFAESV